jgi:hypothetical protein
MHMQMVMVIMAIMAHQGKYTQKTGDKDFIRCTLTQLGRGKYGVGLLFMAFWHGLRWIIGLQCRIALTKEMRDASKGYKEYIVMIH